MNQGQQQHSTTHKQPFLFLFPFVLVILMFLTGCVNYDVGVDFEGQYRGTFVQRINLGEQLVRVSPTAAKEWLASIENRVRDNNGKLKVTPSKEVLITIPFTNGKDFVAKFNNLFNPNEQKVSELAKVKKPQLEQLYSEISLLQSNLLLAQRDRLRLAVDLRALKVLSEQDKLVVNPESLVDLEFSLNTPWGARGTKRKNVLTPKVLDRGHKLVWQLQPGEINYIEAVFWLPSPIGVGAVIIVAVILIGFYIKYRSFPWSPQSPQENLSPNEG